MRATWTLTKQSHVDPESQEDPELGTKQSHVDPKSQEGPEFGDDELSKVNTKLQNDINELHTQLQEKPKEIEKAASGDLREAARLMAQSELNKEDLSEDDIYEMLQKSSEEDVKRKIGFWAMPLPTDDTEPKDTNKRYIGKA